MRKLSSPRFALFIAVSTAAGAAAWMLADAPVSSADPTPPTASVAPKPGRTTDSAAIKAAVERLASAVEDLDGHLSASVVAVEDGRELGAHRADTVMNPASNAKLVTAAAAMHVLGGDHRFATGLFGKVEDGKVSELVLRGRGDPSLTTADLRGLVRQLRVAGVSEVGGIVVDQSWFAGLYTPPAFEQQPNEWAPFRAPTAAVSIDRNTVTLWVRPASEAKKNAALVVDPPGFVDIEGSIETSARDSAEKIVVDMEAKGDRLVAKVRGAIPLGSKPVPAIRRVEDPRSLAGYALRAILREQGIKAGDGVKVEASKTTSALAVRVGPTVAELLPRLGKDSDNFTAEMLLLAIGAEKDKATADAGVRAVTAFLEERGALGTGAYVKNGSGLFDANRFSAGGLTKLLVWAASQPEVAPEYVAHLAIGGVDGTLRGRLKKWADHRAVRAKTGTLADHVALSGYILDERGRAALAFSFMTSGVKGKTGKARDAIDEAAAALAASVWK